MQASSTGQARDKMFCHLCQKEVGMDRYHEYMILILARNDKSNRIIFHCECFFSAAGKEYKQALGYDQMTPNPPFVKPLEDEEADQRFQDALRNEKSRLADDKMHELLKKVDQLEKTKAAQMHAAQKMPTLDEIEKLKELWANTTLDPRKP